VDWRYVSVAKSGPPFAAEETCRLYYENNGEPVLDRGYDGGAAYAVPAVIAMRIAEKCSIPQPILQSLSITWVVNGKPGAGDLAAVAFFRTDRSVTGTNETTDTNARSKK